LQIRLNRAEEPCLQDGLRLEVFGYCLLHHLCTHKHIVLESLGKDMKSFSNLMQFTEKCAKRLANMHCTMLFVERQMHHILYVAEAEDGVEQSASFGGFLKQA
jgi:hypothetical protein